MVQLPGTFDSSKVEPNKALDPIPAGKYLVAIAEATFGEINSGKGSAIKITHEIADGEHRGRKVFSNLCIVHENQQTQEIAERQLSGLCRALGIGQLSNTDQLVNHVCIAKIKVRPAKDGYDASNDVQAYEAAPGGRVAASQPVGAGNGGGEARAWTK